MMNRSLSRAARLRQIETLLFHNPNGIKVTDIAYTCRVNRRTIYRDIDLLTDTGVPIWEDNGSYGIARDQYLATIRLTLNEATALYIAARLLARHADEYNPYIVSALNKLATAFPDPLSGYIARTAQTIQDRPIDSRFVQVLETLTLCWIENHKVHLWYRSPQSSTARERDFAPYTIEPSIPGGLYTIGYDESAHDIRTFKVERIEKATRLPDTYTIPPNFDPRTHLADAWGIMTGPERSRVRLRFTPAAGTFIRERIWHPSQHLNPLPDGSVEFQVEVADAREMRPWIRSWGAEVEVIEPLELRADLIEETRQLARRYDLLTPDET